MDTLPPRPRPVNARRPAARRSPTLQGLPPSVTAFRLTPAVCGLVAGFARRHPDPLRVYRSMFPKVYRRCRRRGMPVPELRAVCWEGVVRAARMYHPGCGATFDTYAAFTIGYAVRSARAMWYPAGRVAA